MALHAITCLLKSIVARFFDLASAFLIKALASLLSRVGILFIAIAMIQMIYPAKIVNFIPGNKILVKYGRKPLLMIGSIGMAIGMFAIGGLAFMKVIGISTLVFIIIYTASFMMSWGPIC